MEVMNDFKKGLRDGIPIALAYVSVSFAFGIFVRSKGLTSLLAFLISATNLTSAGQFAGTEILAGSLDILELVITTLIINLRYSLMSLSISQKVLPGMGTLKRMLLSFGITDEVFAVISREKGKIGARYFLGLIVLPYFGWTLGTVMGACAGGILPETVRIAMSVAIYGMFIAIIVPPAICNKKIFVTVGIAVLLSSLCKYVPVFNFISGGWVIIVASLVSAGVSAYLFPIDDEQ